MAQEYRIDVAVDPSKAISGGKRVEQQINSMGSAAERLRSTLTRVFAVLGGGIAFRNFAKNVADYQKSIAEVSTLVNTATFDMQGLNRAALRNAKLFGSPPVAQAKAFYNIISAGASNAADANKILEAANRLAIGGVTDLETATDGLTSVLNAYGLSGAHATSVSDTFFTAMKAGKTTVGELSGAIGRVLPTAAALGVNFETVAAALAALTKSGISTKEATTGLNAVFGAALKPSAQASELADQLGISFNSTALEAKGLQQFLLDVIAATGGSEQKLSTLFGNLEAIRPIMALAGQAGVDFAAIMEQMGIKTGATDEAVAKMENTLSHQFGRVLQNAKAALLETGGALDGLIPILKRLADNFQIATDAVKSLGIAMLVAFSPRIIVVAINSIIAALRRLTAAALANPYTAIAAAIAIVISLIYTFRDQIADIQIQGVRLGNIWAYVTNQIRTAVDFFVNGWRTSFSDVGGAMGVFLADFKELLLVIADAAKQILNLIIGYFVNAVESWKFLFSNFVPFVKDLFNRMVNNFQAAIEAIVHAFGAGIDQIRKLWNFVANAAIDAINAGIDALNNLNGGVKDFVFAAVGLLEDFLGAVDGIWTNIANFGIRAANEILEAWNKVTNAIKNALGLQSEGRARAAVIEQFGQDRAAGLIGRPDAIATERERLNQRIADLEQQFTSQGLQVPTIGNTPSQTLQRMGSNDPARQLIEARQQSRSLMNLESVMDRGLAQDKAFQIKELDSLGLIDRGMFRVGENGDLQIKKLDNIDFQGGTFDNFGFNRLPTSDAGLQTLRDFTDRIADNYRRDYLGEGGNALLNNAANFRDVRASNAFDEQFDAPQGISQAQADAAQPYVDTLNEIIAKQDELAQKTQSFGERSAEIYENLGQTLSDGVANSIAQAIVNSEDLGDSLRNVAKQALVEFIAEQLKLQFAQAAAAQQGQVLQAQATATTSAAMGAIAAAAAPAATLTSLATAGTNAVGANAALTSTAAIAKGIAAFRDGTDFVRGAGNSLSDSILARLSVGEGVVTAAANRRNPGAVAAMNRGESMERDEPDINLNVQVQNYSTANIQVERLSETDVRIIAREESSRAVSEQSPGIIAGEIASPNSRVSRALSGTSNFIRRAR